jgi:NAD(P)H-dependent FMN reductase
MLKDIVAFGASNSKNSINRQFAKYAAHLVNDAKINLLDLNDYEMPIYSIDREKEDGIPTQARQFITQINEADGIIISFAEHNGNYTVAFKNIIDWTSRVDKQLWSHVPICLLATSPGKRGGASVLDIAERKFRLINKNLVVRFSLPLFSQNFSQELGIIDHDLNILFKEHLHAFSLALKVKVDTSSQAVLDGKPTGLSR